MRLTTDIWVHVFLRREAARGAFACVLQKGPAEAGAIFISENTLNGVFNLYGPAPQSMLDEEDGERRFETVLHGVEEPEIKTYLDKQNRFDPDIWVVEIDCREGPPTISLINQD